MTICKITTLTAHFMCCLMSDLLIYNFTKSIAMHDSVPGVIKQHKTKGKKTSTCQLTHRVNSILISLSMTLHHLHVLGRG